MLPPRSGTALDLRAADRQALAQAAAVREARQAERRRRRRIRVLAGAVLLLPLFTWFFTPAGFTRLWLQVPLAAGYGLWFWARRPGPAEGAAGTVAAGLLTLLASGCTQVGFGFVLSLFFYGLLGLALGAAEELGRADGE